jgi:hypothetical protein
MAKGFAVTDAAGNVIHSLYDDGRASLSGTIGVTGSFNPVGDGVVDNGSASNRWGDLYAVQTTVGAIFESGLTTPGISKYPTGTVLSWGDGGLVPCHKKEDLMVMGVVKEGKDQPIVFGAEYVKVTGKVKPGDYIVTSKKFGHGQAAKKRFMFLFKRDLFGKVLGQALEHADGESSLIKCMILKM